MVNDRKWNQSVEKLRDLSRREKENAFAVGDLLLDLREKYGKAQMLEAADQAGIANETARGRVWISERFPKGHVLRDSLAFPISYSMLKVIATEPDPVVWATRATKEQWGVAKLRSEIRAERDPRLAAPNHSEAVFCANFRCGVLLGEDYIQIRVHGGTNQGEVCSPRCGVIYLLELEAHDPTN